MNNVLTDSEISSKAKLFRNIRCVNSNISSGCTIGDDCDIDRICMEDRSELGRRNLIRDVVIGRGSYTGTNTIIKKADIGRYCCISWNVSIGGGNHDYTHTSLYTDYWFKRTFGIENDFPSKSGGRTIVGNDVWIAAGVNIIGGVQVGDGCVIGAGCVVNHNLEPYSIVVGVPGQTIKKRFDDETIDLLEKLKWWDWSDERIRENIDLLRGIPQKETLRELLAKYNASA